MAFKKVYDIHKDIVPLTIKDSVWTETSKMGAEVLQHELGYTTFEWKKTPKGRRKIPRRVTMVYGMKDGSNKFIFPTGLVPRAEAWLQKTKVSYRLKSEVYPVDYDDPHVDGITFYDYQERLIYKGIEDGRGVLKAATGTGKSIVLLGLMSAFSEERILFLVHTVDLIAQMEEHLKKQGFTDFGVRQGKRREDNRIILSTVQTFSKEVIDWCNHFDVILIDEVHHCNSLDSKNYGYTMQHLLAPVKLGVTATLPDTEEKQKQLEALVGPVLEEYDIKEASEDGVIAKPKVKFLYPGSVLSEHLHDKEGVPKGKNGEDPTKYKVVYYNGIVRNFNRNRRIIQYARDRLKKNKSVLIKVVYTEHGRQLMDVANDMIDDIYFVHGGTVNKERERIKKLFNEKKIKCVVATDVYKEGIDVKSLNTCIIAAGLKSELTTYQNIGRGVRIDEGKTEVEIVDFKDTCHKYLRNHFDERYRVCSENDWIVYEEDK